MPKSLVIVESPAKAKTINKYLGRNYSVKASIGHIMDLPKKDIGIVLPEEEPSAKKVKKKSRRKADPAKAEKAARNKRLLEQGKLFEPTYVVIPGKEKVVNDLRKSAATAENVYLAADPDREGEAICAHLEEALTAPASFVYENYDPNAGGWRGRGRFGKKAKPETTPNGSKNGDHAKEEKPEGYEVPKDLKKRIFRVMFNEITPKAIKAAFEKAGKVDEKLVDAQQARRVLDRIVGYKISPLLWDKVRRGLSAGRVQTVALRLIVEREQEIKAFVPKEYWTIHARLEANEAPVFEAKLTKYKGEDLEISNEAQATKIVEDLKRATWTVAEVTQREKRRHAYPAVYDFEAAAGVVQPVPIFGQAHDGLGAEIV